jgi:hypothetical protein
VGKLIESFDVDEWDVWTDDGWKEIQQVHKTVKYDVWKVKTDSFTLECADEHIIIDKNYNQVYVKDLKKGDRVLTENGIEKVRSVKRMKRDAEYMYDMSINSKTHTFYTNGILSHNTTISTVYLLHYILFNKDKTVAILANKEPTAIEILRRVQLAFKSLPLWLQQGVIEGGWNKKSIFLENGIRAIAATTSSDSISGETVSLLYMDEFAKVKSHIAEEFVTATFPVVSSGKTSKIIIVSTPVGMNHFYEFWSKATQGVNNFYPIRVSWQDHPDRDEAWKDDMIQTFGKHRFMQEYSCKFLGSSDTLIDGDVLERCPVKEADSYLYGGLMAIYEPLKKDAKYILGVDSAKGTQRDSSVIQVLRIVGEHKIKQSAVYAYNNIKTHEFAQVCIEVSRRYNGAYMMVENNGEGGEVANTIWYEYEYDYIINCDAKGDLGIRSTKKSKLAANINLKRYLESGWLDIYDRETVTQLSKYVEVTPNVFKAETRTTHDDYVTSLIWGLYYLLTDFYDEKNTDRKDIDDEFKIEMKTRLCFSRSGIGK